MIVVAGKVPVKPEARAAAVAAAERMAQATRAEPGCISYGFFADVSDPNTILIFEEWEEEAALTRHFATPHMAAFAAEIPRFVAGPAAIKRYVVESVSSM
jgi:quinol monooxygenase YgiN